MPFVNIQLKEGRTPAQKKEVAEAIIDLMDQLDFAKAESIRVIFEDMAEEDFHQGQAK